MRRNDSTTRASTALLLLALAGCARQSGDEQSLQFAVDLGNLSVADCTTQHRGTDIDQRRQITQLRFYVHNIRLITASGETSFDVADRSPWQHNGIALVAPLMSSCDKPGQLNTRVTGSALPGPYLGVRFDLGVPFAANHANPAAAVAPLNIGSMFWTWQLGYKFLRFDTQVPGNPDAGWSFHLGSQGCRSPSAVRPPDVACQWPNRASVQLSGVDPMASTIIVRADALAGFGATLTNTTSCMGSFIDSPVCAGRLTDLGLQPATGACRNDCAGQRIFDLVAGRSGKRAQ